MKWPSDFVSRVICADCLEAMHEMPDNSVDVIVTDPPYGLSFMGKDWDKAVPSVEIWRECERVLKPGAFAFVMSSPRLDCLGEMSRRLQEARFLTHFTPIFWTYASGFPKAQNISKEIDKKACRKLLGESLGREPTKKEFEQNWKHFREIVGKNPNHRPISGVQYEGIYAGGNTGNKDITAPATREAQELEGAFGGFQPKPAVEVVIVAMKRLDEKTFAAQAMKNRKGVTWLDDCRVPYESDDDIEKATTIQGKSDSIYGGGKGLFAKSYQEFSPKNGRFPANLLVSDDVLNDGKTRQSGHKNGGQYDGGTNQCDVGDSDGTSCYADTGSFSRYFDIDAWWEAKLKELPESVRKTFPFLIVPKASKSEKERGCERLPLKRMEEISGGGGIHTEKADAYQARKSARKNFHPTVKPVKLMCYLITLGSRQHDVVLDPFAGTCTTGIAARLMQREFVMIDNDESACKLGEARLSVVSDLSLEV